MVGNDFVINFDKRAQTERPDREPVQQVVMPRGNEESRGSYQNFGTLAFNSPVTSGHPAFALPSVSDLSARFLSRTSVMTLAAVLVVLGLAVGTVAFRQQIAAQVSDIQYNIRLIEQNATKKKVVAPIPNPRQLLVHNSDYDSAMIALISQPITLNIGSSSISVSSSEIMNWLNVGKQGSLTDITVKMSSLNSYLTQEMSGAGSTAVNAASNKIANNILKGQGITVTENS